MKYSRSKSALVALAACGWLVEIAAISQIASGQVIVTGTPVAQPAQPAQPGGGPGEGGGRGGRRGRGGRGGGGGEGQPAIAQGGNAEGGQPGGGRGRGRRGNRGDNPGNPEGGPRQGGPPTASAPATSSNDAMRQLFTRYDRNGDGALQADESRVLGGRAASFDSDSNGAISLDEFNAGMAGGARGRGRGPGSENNTPNAASEQPGRGRGENRGNEQNNNNDNDNSGNNNNNRNRNNNDDNDDDKKGNNNNNRNRNRAAERTVEAAKTFPSLIIDRKSYRLRSGKDSVPKEGMPAWFASRDKNGDGQVAMSEYAARLTDSLMEEFIGRDKNGDGFITADEAAGTR